MTLVASESYQNYCAAIEISDGHWKGGGCVGVGIICEGGTRILCNRKTNFGSKIGSINKT